MNKRERIQALEARVLDLEQRLAKLEGMAHSHPVPPVPPHTTAKPWWLGPGTGDPLPAPYRVTCTDPGMEVWMSEFKPVVVGPGIYPLTKG